MVLFAVALFLLLTHGPRNAVLNSPENLPTYNLVQENGTESPISEEVVTDQPAYLIAAYSKGNSNYLEVDYIQTFSGEASSIQAQIEDGHCQNETDCYAFPNGYKRNQNPKIRTLLVSPGVIINAYGDAGSKIFNGLPGDQRGLVSFEQFSEAVSNLKTYYDAKPGFKVPKTYIHIDVINGVVTKIIEPYQE